MRRTRFLLWLPVIVCLLSLPAAAQPPFAGPIRPGDTLPQPQSLTSLINNGVSDEFAVLLGYSVQIELGLSDRQKQQVKTIEREMAAEQGRRARRFAERRYAAQSEEECQALAVEQIDTIRRQAEANDKRLAALLSEAQRTRLWQIWIQRQGVSALFDPKVVARLKISNDQLDVIGREVRSPLARSPFMKQRSLEKALQVLTAQQRAAFDDLRGKEFASAQERSSGFRSIANGLPNEYGLLQRDEVQAELKLTAQQKVLLEETQRAGSMRAPTNYERLDLMHWATEEEREHLKRFRNVIEDRFEEARDNGERLAAVLTEAQKTRLAQLWIQYLGEGALRLNPEVIAKLNLTDGQREGISLINPLGSNRESTNASRKAALAKALRGLSDRQREKFNELRGKEFEFRDEAWQRRFGFVAPAADQPIAAGPPPKQELLALLALNGVPREYPLPFRGKVQAELQLSDEKKERLRALEREISAAYGRQAGEFLEKMSSATSDEQRRSLTAERIRAIRTQAESNVERVAVLLTDAEKTRLRQLWLRDDPSALLDPEVVAQLMLTDEQVDNIWRLSAGRIGFGGVQGRFIRLADVLTEKQRALLAEMRGKEYETSWRPAREVYEYRLLDMEEVRAELGLGAKQRELLQDIRRGPRSYTEKRNRELAEIARWAPDEERVELIRSSETYARVQGDVLSEQRRIQAEIDDKRITASLTDGQKTRLWGLWIQQRGDAGLYNPKVTEKLKLTDEQKEKLRTVNPPTYSGMSDEFKKSRLAKALAVLTDEQRRQFDELRGREFEFPEPPDSAFFASAPPRLRFGGARGFGGGAGGGGFGGGAGGGGFRGGTTSGGWSDYIRGLDADGNGKIEPKEQGRLSAFIKRLAETDPSIDASQPIPIDRLKEAVERYRQRGPQGVNPPNQRENPAQAQSAAGKPSRPDADAGAPPAPDKPAPDKPEPDKGELLRSYAAQLVKKYDKNGDGSLQAVEWKQMSRSPAAADTDGDGNITPHELAAWYMKR